MVYHQFLLKNYPSRNIYTSVILQILAVHSRISKFLAFKSKIIILVLSMMIFVSVNIQQKLEEEKQQALAFHIETLQNQTIPEARQIAGSIENQLNATRQALRNANLTGAFFHLGLAQQELAVLEVGNSTIGMYNVLPAPSQLASSSISTFQGFSPPPPSVGSFSSSPPPPPPTSSQPSLSGLGGTFEVQPSQPTSELAPTGPTTELAPPQSTTQIIRPGESFQTTQPSLESQPSLSSQPSQSIRPSSPTQPSQPTQPTQPSQPTQPVVP